MTNDERTRRIEAMLQENKGIDEISRTLGVNPIEVALLESKRKNKTQIDSVNPTINPNIAPQINILNKVSEHGDMLIGYTPNYEPVFWHTISSANPHLMIVGESGFGKTYAITGFICEQY